MGIIKIIRKFLGKTFIGIDYDEMRELKKRVLFNEDRVNRINQVNISTAILHQKTFPQFKGIHQGREIVIFAGGPSAIDYIPIENAIHIGVNRSFEMNKVLMNYIFLQDYSGKTPEYIDILDNYEPDKCIKFYGLTNEFNYKTNRTIPEGHAIRAKAFRYRTDWTPFKPFTSKFAYDLSTQPLGCFGSVTFPALQFALWTYPKRIYLVGCDCSLAGYAYSNEKNFLEVDVLTRAYLEFKQFANKYYPDVEIISINAVGLKGIFRDIYQGENYV